jgi:transposase
MNKYKQVSKEELVREYVGTGKSISEVRHKFGMTHKTFVRALKHHGIKVMGRQSKYPRLRDKVWLKKRYIEDKQSIPQIAAEIGATNGAVSSALRWVGISLRKIRAGVDLRYPNGRFGGFNPRWKGGRRRAGTNKAYIYVYSVGHPFAVKEGYVMEHRLVMEKHLGRYLKPTEVVHHLNGIKDDNRIENLELVKNRGEHVRGHYHRSFLTEQAEAKIAALEAENALLRAQLPEKPTS